VAFRDTELGLIRLRAFGSFSMRVTQPLLFLNTLVGTVGSYSTANVEDYLREVIVSRLNDFLGESVDTLFNLPKYYDELAVAVKTRLSEDFRKYGMELIDLFINRITPPEEVQKMIDDRSGMEAVGDLGKFMQFKAAKAIGDAAIQPGGATLGLGTGMGAGLGMMLPGMLYQAINARPEARQLQGAEAVACPSCHGEVPLDSRFCSHCGRQLVVIQRCPRCAQDLSEDAKFCSSCGLELRAGLACSNCAARLPPETRFCMSCGDSVTALLES
jgi:membrane protease subunit (stomatin/prohibitin family)